MTGLKIGSLFTGYGGLDIAVESVFGATTAWTSEINPGARKVIAHRMPGVPNHGDITTIDWSTVEPVDIITGGSPCQDLSTAGPRAGMTDGTRSNLWVQMREAIAHVRPRFVVWENVRGAYSAPAHSDLEHCPGCMGDPRERGPVLRALGRVVGDLADLGYVGQFRGLRAADVGACHGRFRVFVLAWRRDAAHTLSEPRHERRQPAPGETKGGRALGESPRCGGAPVTLLPTPTTQDAKNLGAPSQMERNTLPLNAQVLNLLPTIRTANNENRQSEGFMGDRGNFHGLLTGSVDWGEYAPAIRRHELAFGRPAPSPTEPGKTRPRLSARFAEWMMGLPEGWVDVEGVSRNEQLKALGNGVVPQQAIAALQWCLAARRAMGVAA